MDDTRAPARTNIGTTALGRIQMRVADEDGFQDVMVERRWPDMAAARSWCERILDRAAAETKILEIQVFEERWQHAKSWETTKNHPVAVVLQLGVATAERSVRWATPLSMSPSAGARHLL